MYRSWISMSFESLIYPSEFALLLPQCISYTCALPSSIQFLPIYFCKCDNHKCNILWHLPFVSSSRPSWSRVCANVPTSMCSTSETHCYSQSDPLRMPLLWDGCTTSPVTWTRGWVVLHSHWCMDVVAISLFMVHCLLPPVCCPAGCSWFQW